MLWATFALCLAFGAVAQRTRFCTMGAVSDAVLMGSWSRARMWALAIAIAILGFNLMVGLQWVEARHSIYAGHKLLWLSAIGGGLMFGFGMVLASGCGSRSLIKLGGGNLKSLVVLLVIGLTAFMTMRGLIAVARVNSIERVVMNLPTGQDLPSLIGPLTGVPAHVLAPWLAIILAVALIGWVIRRPDGRSSDVWLGGVGIGAIIVATWWVSGRLGYIEEHPDTLEQTFLATNSRRMESLSFVAPVGYLLDWLMYFSDQSKLITLGITSLFGVVLGSSAASLASRSFRWEGFTSLRDLGDHLVGATLMGVGGVIGLGCTIGQGISGVSTLSVGSFLTLGAIIIGAVMALRFQLWSLDA